MLAYLPLQGSLQRLSRVTMKASGSKGKGVSACVFDKILADSFSGSTYDTSYNMTQGWYDMVWAVHLMTGVYGIYFVQEERILILMTVTV